MQNSNEDIGETLNYIRGVYICGLCKTYSRSGPDFRTHLETHAFNRLYRCFYCSALSPSTSSLTKHITKEHPGKEIYLGCMVHPTINQIIHILCLNKDKKATGGQTSVHQNTPEEAKPKEKETSTTVASQQAIELDQSSDSDIEITGESRVPVPNKTTDQETPQSGKGYETKLQVEYSDGQYVCKSCDKTALSPGRFAFHIHSHLHASTLKEHNCRYCRTDAVSIAQKCKLVEQLMGILEKQKEAQTHAKQAVPRFQIIPVQQPAVVQPPTNILKSLIDTSAGSSGTVQPSAAASGLACVTGLAQLGAIPGLRVENNIVASSTAISADPFTGKTSQQQTEEDASLRPSSTIGPAIVCSPIVIEPKSEIELTSNPIIIEPSDPQTIESLLVANDNINAVMMPSDSVKGHQQGSQLEALAKEKQSEFDTNQKGTERPKKTTMASTDLATEPKRSSDIHVEGSDSQTCSGITLPAKPASNITSSKPIDCQSDSDSFLPLNPAVPTNVQTSKPVELSTEPASSTDIQLDTDSMPQQESSTSETSTDTQSKTADASQSELASASSAALCSDILSTKSIASILNTAKESMSQYTPSPAGTHSGAAAQSQLMAASSSTPADIQTGTSIKSTSGTTPSLTSADTQSSTASSSQSDHGSTTLRSLELAKDANIQSSTANTSLSAPHSPDKQLRREDAPSPADSISSESVQSSRGTPVPPESLLSTDSQSSSISNALGPPRSLESPSSQIQDKPDESTKNAELPQSSTKSVVKCYHIDNQFICDRCKFSVPNTKPRAFRKHLWSEVHPTMTCNHCPASVKDNRIMFCPIINQLMNYLLRAKAKHTEGTNAKSKEDSKLPETSKDKPAPAQIEGETEKNQHLSKSDGDTERETEPTSDSKRSSPSTGTVKETENLGVEDTQITPEVQRATTPLQPEPEQAPSPSVSTVSSVTEMDTTVMDKDSAIKPIEGTTDDAVSIPDDQAGSLQTSPAGSHVTDMEVEQSGLDLNSENLSLPGGEESHPGIQSVDENSNMSTGMFVISSVVSQAATSNDNEDDEISAVENKEQTGDVDKSASPDIDVPEQQQSEIMTTTLGDYLNFELLDAEVEKNYAEFRSNPEHNTLWVKAGPNTPKRGKLMSRHEEAAARAWPYSWDKTRQGQPHVPPASEQVTADKVYVCSYYKCSFWVAQNAASFKIHNLVHHAEARNFSCAFCGRTFSTEDSLIMHMDAIHTEPRLVIYFKSYHCGFKDCWLACERDVEFSEHNKLMHQDAKSYPCCFCDQPFQSVPELIKHIDESVTYSCTRCPEVTKCTYGAIKRHMTDSFHLKAVSEAGSKESLINLSIKCVLSNVTGETKPKTINRFVYLARAAFAPAAQQVTFECSKCALVTNDEAFFETHASQCVGLPPAVAINKPKPSLLSPPTVSGASKGPSQEPEGPPTPKTGDRRKAQHKERAWYGEDVEYEDSHRTDEGKHSKPESDDDDDCVEIPDDDIDDYNNDVDDDNDVADGDDNGVDNNENNGVSPPADDISPMASTSTQHTKEAPKLKRTVLHSLGVGLQVTCEKCSFNTTFRVVHAIHERVHKHTQDKTKMLWCPHCPYSTDTILYFKIHLQCHTEKSRIRVYHCTHCPFACTQLDVVDDHHEDVHENLDLKSEVTRLVLEDLLCPDCPSTLKTEGELLKHLEEEHAYSTVQKYLKEMYTIANLEIVEEKKPPKEHQAVPEVKITPTSRAPRRETLINRPGEDLQLGSERFKCPYCDYSHESCLRWIKHMQGRHKSDVEVLGLYCCQVCSWISTSKQKTSDHCQEKHGQVSVKFEIMKISKLIEQEKKAGTEDVGSSDDDDDDIEIIDDGQGAHNKDAIDVKKDVKKEKMQQDSKGSSEHVCPFCSYTAHDFSKMQKHWVTHEGQSALSSIEDEEDSLGEAAPVDSTDPPSEQPSEQLREQPRELKYTEENIKYIEDLLANLEKEELKSSKDIVGCPMCPYSTDYKNNMRQHLRRHLKQASIKHGFKCSYCAMSHKVEGVVTAHIRKFHPDLPIVKEKIGNAQLREEDDPSNGQRHVCNLCPFTTAHKHNLWQHLDRHKKQDMIQNGYKCSHCVFKSEIEGIVKKHCKRYHPSLPISCEVIGSPKSRNKPHALASRQALAPEHTMSLRKPLAAEPHTLASKQALAAEPYPLASRQAMTPEPHTLASRQALAAEPYPLASRQAMTPEPHTLASRQALAAEPYPYESPQGGSTYKTPLERLRDFSAIFAQDEAYTNDIRHVNQNMPEPEAAGDDGIPGLTIAAVVGSDGSRNVMGSLTSEHVLNAQEYLRMENRAIEPLAGPQMTSEGDGFDENDGGWKFCMPQFCSRMEGYDVYKCNNCSFFDKDSRIVHRHFSTSHREQCPFQCGYCDFRSVAVVIIQKHCMAKHSHLQVKVSPVVESLPDPEEVAQQPPRQHIPRAKLHDFVEDEGTHINVSLDQKYDEWASQYYTYTRQKGFTCSTCGYAQKSKILIVNHILAVHLKHYIYRCMHCDYRNIAPYKALRHVEAKHPDLEQKVLRRDIPDGAYLAIGRVRELPPPVEIQPMTTTQPNNILRAMVGAPTFKEEGNITGQGVNFENMYGYDYSTPAYAGTQEEDDSNLSAWTVKTEPEENTTVPENNPVQEIQERTELHAEQGHKYKYKCGFCDFGAKFDCFNVKVHVLTCHLRLHPFSCRHCRWGSASRKVYLDHFAKHHPDLPANPEETRQEIGSALSMVKDGLTTIIGLSDKASVIEQIYERNIRGRNTRSDRSGNTSDQSGTMSNMSATPSPIPSHHDLSHSTPAPLVIAPIGNSDGLQMRENTSIGGMFNMRENTVDFGYGMTPPVSRDQFPPVSRDQFPPVSRDQFPTARSSDPHFSTMMQGQSDPRYPTQLSAPNRAAKPKGKKKKQKTYTLYKCKACGRGYMQKAKAQNHFVIKHLNLHPYMCNYCDFGDNTRTQVFEHIKRKHPGQETVAFPAFREHPQARNKIVPIKTDLSEYKGVLKKTKFISDSGMLHAKNQQGETKFHCPQCVDTFSNVDLLDQHVATLHTDYNGFKCCQCGVYIKAKAKMKYHHEHRHPNLEPRYLMVKEGIAGGNPLNTFSERIGPKTQYLTGQPLGGGGIHPSVSASFPYSRALTDAAEKAGFSDFQGNISGKITGDFIEDATLEVNLPAGQLGLRETSDLGSAPFKVTPPVNKSVGGTTLLSCKHCPYSTWRKKMMRQHVMSHINYRPFKCSHCSFNGITSFHVRRHMTTRHPNLPQNIKFIVDREMQASLPDHYTSEVKTSQNNAGHVSSLAIEKSKQIVRKAMDDGIRPMKKMKLQSPAVGGQLGYPPGGEMVDIASRAYVCILCGQPAPNRSSLLQHIMLELNYCPWHCPHCSYKDVTLFAVKNHCFKVHPRKQFRTVLKQNPDRMLRIQSLVEQSKAEAGSGKSMPTSTVVREEDLTRNPEKQNKSSNYFEQFEAESLEQTGPPYKCKKCHFQTDEKYRFRSHVKRHGPRLFRCPHCSQGGVVKAEVLRHVGNMHPDKPYRVIDLRKQGGNTQTKTMNVPDTEHQQESGLPYKCDKCTYQSNDKNALKKHLRRHGPKLFKCMYCHVSDVIRGDLYRHVREMHPNEPCRVIDLREQGGDSQASTAAQDPQENPGFMGQGIRESADSPGGEIGILAQLDAELEDMAPEEMNISDAELREQSGPPYNCTKCDYQTNDQYCLRVHFKRHGPKLFKCMYCDMAGVVRGEVNKHVRKVHPSKPCRVIDLREQSGNALTATSGEISQRHPGITRQGTPETADSSSSERGILAQLDEELQDLSSEELDVLDTDPLQQSGPPYNCNKCEYQTNDKQCLGKHLKRHGPKLFKCMYCDVAGVIRGEVSRHVRDRHPNKPCRLINLREQEEDAYRPPAKKRRNSDERERNIPEGAVSIIDGIVLTEDHMTISADGMHHCQFCGFSANREKCRTHVTKHLEPRWKCGYCKVTHQLSYELKRHIRHVHSGRSMKMFRLESPEVSVPSHTTIACNKRSSVSPSKPYQPEPKPGPASSKKQPSLVPTIFCCYHCTFKTSSTSELVQHQKTHAESEKSETVTEISSESSDAESDHGSPPEPVAEEVATYSCALCPYTTHNKEGYKVHKEFAHTPPRPFKCAYCSFTGFVCAKVKTHCKRMHKDQPVSVVDQRTNRVRTESQSESDRGDSSVMDESFETEEGPSLPEENV